jgi:ketosteroid isomerase-like protein
MADHPNIATVAAMYADASGAAWFTALSPDVTWHFPGSSWMGGTYNGVPDVLRLFMTLGAFTDNTFKAVPRAIVGGDDHVVSIVDASATFREHSFDTSVAVVWTFQDGRIVDVREHVYDLAGLDDFWAGERPDGW